MIKKRKYFNKKTGGYDSKKEARRAGQLKLLEKDGIISELKEQVPFVILESFKGKDGKTERGIKYYADFTYIEGGHPVIEDVKSAMTSKLPAYIMKRKLVKYKYPEYDFRET